MSTHKSDTTPLVTIITPTYNRADYLAETIESVLSQDYPHIEYIVLDDGSKDNTHDILQRYSNRVIWDSHPNMGETRTVNKGFTMAKGDLVAVVNSDDPLLPKAISTAVKFMAEHPEALVGYPDWAKIGPDGGILEHVQVPDYNYINMLKRHHCIVGPGAFIRKKAFTLTGMRDIQFKYVADFEYWLRLGLHGDFVRIPQELATFRVHPNSTSVAIKGAGMAEEHIRLMKLYYSFPNLPQKAVAVRAEAWSWAYHVAAYACGTARSEARKYHIKSILACPATYKGQDYNRLLPALSTLVPWPINSIIFPLFRRITSIIR